jgi:hypothetical protein
LIVGAQRCGTTSLYQYLGEHPAVAKPVRKELQYFSLHFTKGLGWYRSHFPRAGDGRHTFEATPYYLFHPAAAARAASVLPEARIIVLVRDPVERAVSHYHHNVGLGVETLSFDAALAAEEERLAGERERLVDDPRYPGTAHRRYGYFARGCYAPQLEGWYQHYSKDRVLVVLSEDFYRDTGVVFAQVLAFLGLSPLQLDSYHRYTRRPPGGDGAVSDASRERLRRRYGALNQELAELLGRDPGWHG